MYNGKMDTFIAHVLSLLLDYLVFIVPHNSDAPIRDFADVPITD